MAVDTRVDGCTITLMVKVPIQAKMAIYTKVNGEEMYHMEKVNNNGTMVAHMLVIIYKVSNMAMEHIACPTAMYIKVNGKMTYFTVKEQC